MLVYKQNGTLINANAVEFSIPDGTADVVAKFADGRTVTLGEYETADDAAWAIRNIGRQLEEKAVAYTPDRRQATKRSREATAKALERVNKKIEVERAKGEKKERIKDAIQEALLCIVAAASAALLIVLLIAAISALIAK